MGRCQRDDSGAGRSHALGCSGDFGRHAGRGVGVDNQNAHGVSDFPAQVGGFDSFIAHQGLGFATQNDFAG